ncbi:iroquois-class homeodomain protein irx-2 [Frankliniella occidentalis]|uniref:Iroquois-class homeodomain protein irx-2 n=1 Tax=Frankliniella occidentalis TaxID=133901 RepID=A0A6J1T0T5_FRAOC|nr:iroquois-class homeodomain protein irx-2 [Frankliniella occidentalis]XP_052131358.1 iroquois-class homeodomain protein irx-2 [Frankliniella occidentalis]
MMISARGFPQHPPCFISAASPASPGPRAAAEVEAGDLWGRVLLTPPDTPTSPSSTTAPFSPFVHSNDPSDDGSPSPSPPRGARLRATLEPTRDSPPEPPSEPHTAGWRLRSRRHRLSTRPVKRPFTPDIKKLLKGWLVRRRDNPYPSRAEKEALASRTGLTYMQVCNWFANWRRKLRDCARPEDGDAAGEDDADSGPSGGEGTGSWAHLIRRYNALAAAPNSSTAQEHFSISSSDSIWQADGDATDSDTCRGSSEAQQNAYVSSTTTECTDTETRSDVTKPPSPLSSVSVARKRGHSSGDADGESAASWPAVLGEAKRGRKQEGVEDLEDLECASGSASGSALLLSKWLESAARYQPNSAAASAPGWGIASVAVEHTLEGRHREELDAAEALAFLSSLHFR